MKARPVTGSISASAVFEKPMSSIPPKSEAKNRICGLTGMATPFNRYVKLLNITSKPTSVTTCTSLAKTFEPANCRVVPVTAGWYKHETRKAEASHIRDCKVSNSLDMGWRELRGTAKSDIAHSARPPGQVKAGPAKIVPSRADN